MRTWKTSERSVCGGQRKIRPPIHDTTKRAPIELFIEQEQSALQPLPLHPYDTSGVYLKVCDAEGFINLETNRYSAPSGNMADILSIKATEHEILIYTPELDLIACHERQPAGSGRKMENPEHFKTKKYLASAWNL